MLITTNETFQEKKINQYLGQVNEQIVVGANIFKDVFASFRDVFGGETKGYKKELNKLKQASLKGLTDQAKELNANGVIGFRMDIDELSGGGKSMFMLNVFGTAVEFSNENEMDASASSNKQISSEELVQRVERMVLKEKIENGLKPVRDIDLDVLVKYEIFDVISLVIENFDKLHDHRKDLQKYFESVPASEMKDYLNDSIHKPEKDIWETIISSLKTKGWLDIEFLLGLLSDNNSIRRFRALHLCTVGKKYYSKADIESHTMLLDFLNNDFNINPDITSKESTFSTNDVWKCPRCFVDNKASKDKCSNCGANKYGFKSLSLKDLKNELSRKSAVLKESFS